MMVSHDLALGAGPNVEGWLQIGELGLGFLLSAVVGLEREIRQKSAGLRTHTLVGVGAALFVLISKYGFTDVLIRGEVVLDPSRVAAQIVSGVGFLGAGLIFVRRDSVRGLTTAASIWIAAAIGAAAGAGLPWLAVATTVAYLIITLGFSRLTRRLPRSPTAISVLRVSYSDGRGILRQVLKVTTERGFAIDQLTTHGTGGGDGANDGTANEDGGAADGERQVEVALELHGRGSVDDLAVKLSEIPGVLAVASADANVPSD
jgi:putative Mg2+ transporter-C (MgtC) family protein